MRALLDSENKVIDVQETDFQVHSSCTWIDCDDTVKIGFEYDGANFIDTLSPTFFKLPYLEKILRAVDLRSDVATIPASSLLRGLGPL